MAKKTDAAAPAFATNLHAIFSTDESLEEDGAWVMVNELYGLRIKVRRLRSDSVLKAFERIVRETYGEGKLRKPDDLTADQSQNILKRQLAEAVLVDWEGVRDTKTGEEIEFSTQAALQMMNIKDFREFVYQAANERDTFREELNKEAEGN